MILPASLIKSIEKKISGLHFFSEEYVVHKVVPVGGGCINRACKIVSGSGNFFLKWNDANLFPGMFEAEVKGLALLRSTGTLKVPEVIFYGEESNHSFL